MRFYGNIDLLLNQIKNQVIEQLSSDPTSPVKGRFWYNTTDEVLKYYDGTSIQTIATKAELDEFISNLASTSTGEGASLVGVEDAGNYYDGSTVEAVLQEIGGKLGDSDTDVSNLASALGSEGPASAVTYSSTNYVANGDSAITAIGKLDAQAQVNANAIAQNASDIATLESSKVNKAGDSLTGTLDFQGQGTVTGLTSPTNDTDAATKAYVDTKISGVTWKPPVRVLVADNVADLTQTPLTIDGVTLAVGDRLLLVGQSTASENGVYKVDSVDTTNNVASISRADDTIESADAWFVEEGTNYHDTGWVLTTDGDITVGTTDLTFIQFTGLGEVIAGTGLHKDGNTLSVLLGAGITELPTAEVGLDLYASGGLFLTIDGSTASTDASAQLSILLDGDDLSLSTSGLKISDTFKNTIDTTTTNLQNEIDNVETAVGLNDDGTFSAFSGTNYVDSATTIKNAITLLDTQVKTNADGLAQEISDREAGDTAIRSDLASTTSGKGASLVGVSASFVNASGATQVEAVLEAFDTAITNAGKRYLFSASAAGTSFTISHNLGHQFVVVNVYDSSDNSVIIPESIVATDENTLTVTFSQSVQPIIKIVA